MMQGGGIESFVFRADAGLGRGETAELLANSGRRALLDLLGVKYLIGTVADEQEIAMHNFRKVFEDGGHAVYENLQVMPRVFLASNYEGPPDVFGSEPETVKERVQMEKERRKLIPQKLLSGDFDFRNVIILEKPSPISAQFGPGMAEIVSYKPQEAIVKTVSPEPKLLFLSDNWYPGWKAEVDGDETEIWRANYTFRAVPLVPGEHEVRFFYEPRPLMVGLAVSALSLIMLVFLITSVRNRPAE
jgi:uncharacterized membrane protein YfhO